MATKRIPRSRRPIMKNLNPVFHKCEKSEDNNELPKSLVKQARRTGILKLCGKGLATVPDKVWNLHEPDKEEEIEVTLDADDSEKEENAWWNQQPLTQLDLSSNVLTLISKDVGNLYDLTVLDLHDNALTSVPKDIGKLIKLTRVNLSRNKLTELPNEFFQLHELKYLNLSYNQFNDLNDDISNFYVLDVMDISYNQLTTLPGSIGFLVRLTELTCAYNKLKELPNDITNLRSLKKLDLTNNDLQKLPEEMGGLRKLELLYAQHNDIVELPNFHGCESLKEIHISNNYIKEIPLEFCEQLSHLKILDLRDNKIEIIPDEISMLQSLIRLDLTNNSIINLPLTLSNLAHLNSLQLNGNPIRSIRRDVIQCGTMRILKTLRDRSKIEHQQQKDNAKLQKNKMNKIVHGHNDDNDDGGNRKICNNFMENNIFPDRYKLRNTRCLAITMKELQQIPDEIFIEAKEENVTLVDLSKNKFIDFPSGLIHLTDNVNDIVISQNQIAEIPKFVSQFKRITRIDLSKNYISDLPNEFGLLTTLRELNISYNRFKEIPNGVYELKGLEILLARDNKIEKIDATSKGLGALKRLANLDLTNNNINYVPPILGNLKNIMVLNLSGNSFRQPRQQILEKGTESIMSYLRDRIPA